MTDLRSTIDRAMAGVEASPFTVDDVHRRWDRKQRTQRMAAGFLALAVFVAPIWLVAQGTFDRSIGPAGVSVGPSGSESSPGTIDLAPDGLLVSMDGRPGTGFPERFVPVHQVWVYENGRVITRNELALETQGRISPFVESWLTPAGVDFIRSELLASGLFHADASYASAGGLAWGSMGLSTADGWIEIGWCCSASGPPLASFTAELTDAQADALIGITDGLADLHAWLPSEAWADATTRRFTPASFAVCFWAASGRTFESFELEAVGDRIPGAARQLLRGTERTFHPALPDHAVTCGQISSDDADTLGAILEEDGATRIEGGPSGKTMHVGYALRAAEGSDRTIVTFEPILPHGEWAVMGM